MSVRERRRLLGTRTITTTGDSRCVTLDPALDQTQFPAELGNQVRVELVEDGDDAYLEVHPAEGNDGQV